MFEDQARVLRFMQGYGDLLLADIEPADMCRQPVPGINHPAWIIGHLAMAADDHSISAGGTRQLEGWGKLFGFGTELSGDVADYPAKDKLVEAWHAANERLIAAAQSATAEQLGAPTGGPLAEAYPTVADFLKFSMTGHTSLHLGQLSAWRRADGRARLF